MRSKGMREREKEREGGIGRDRREIEEREKKRDREMNRKTNRVFDQSMERKKVGRNSFDVNQSTFLASSSKLILSFPKFS